MLVDRFFTGESLENDWKNYLRHLGFFLWGFPFVASILVAAQIWVAIPLGLWLGYSLETTLTAYVITSTVIGLYLWFRIYLWEEYKRLQYLYFLQTIQR